MLKDIKIGQIYKAHSDSYTVNIDKNSLNCGARGVLKIKSDGFSVGDYVKVDKKTIVEVLPRKNRFIRPNVSNVDLVVAVFAPEPKPDLYLLDKLYINAVKENVDLIIVVNKQDVGDQVLELIRNEYKDLGIEILSVSSKTGVGILELKEKLKGKLSVLAGQSAAGKTSIVNAMFGLNLKTGELSEKILRGKHTTTRSEIFEQDDIKLIDSPGFAVLDADVEVDEIIECYPEYFEVSKYCKFRGCTHISEPDCKVKELVNSGQFSKERYVRYVEIYNDIAKRRKIYEKD